MTRKIFLTSAAAIVGTLAFTATPAWADGTPECNVVATNNLECGVTGLGATIGSTDSTLVGNGTATPFASSATAVGAEAIASPGFSTGGFTEFFAPPVVDGTTAIGAYSIAAGNGSVAVGDQAIVGTATYSGTGDIAVTGTDFGTAIGSHSSVTGTGSTALGYGASDGGFLNSVAIGSNTTNTADNQVAIGGRILTQVAAGVIGVGSTDAINGDQINTIVVAQDVRDDAQDVLIAQHSTDIAALQTSDATQNTQIAALQTSDTAQNTQLATLQAESAYITINSTGAGSTAAGVDAIAIGEGTTASGLNSVAIGAAASTAGFANSIALGAGTANTAANQVAVGGQTVATARTVTGVAAGVLSATSFDAVNGAQLFATNQLIVANAAADAVQNTRLTALEAADVLFDNRLNQVDRHAAAGTAVAIAMGGVAFLPDKKFNLSGNVGMYRGAYAGSLNLGAMISPQAAFNAGIATGFNKGGKIGARVGMTWGW